MFGSFFEQAHLLNLFILGVSTQRCAPKCVRYFKTKPEDHSTGRSLNEKKIYGGTGLVCEKTEALYAELKGTVM